MNALFRKEPSSSAASAASPAFAYFPDVCYMDAACQTPRAQPVLDAVAAYEREHNACGGRVKYRWGAWVDAQVQGARETLLTLAGKSAKEYAVAFTLNTSYGINLVLHQLPAENFERIVTSQIEHNSVFLPTITWAKRNAKERLVLERAADGSLLYDASQLARAVVLLNSSSNIDGRGLPNAASLARDVHAAGGILLLDAAQSFGHDPAELAGIDFDAAFGSGHKMYGPSIGFIIIRRTLLRSLHTFFLGGGTVQDVERDSFTLLSGDQEHERLEVGLQNWAGIVGLRAAAAWLREELTRGGKEREHALATLLFEGVRAIPGVTVLNEKPSSILSLYAHGHDAHRLALYLDERNIMCRSGHFCCHYYLQHVRGLPPLLRVSLGLHNTSAHVHLFLDSLRTIVA